MRVREHRRNECVYLGLGQLGELRRREDYDEKMRATYVDPVEQFPEKVDQLMMALDRVTIC